MKRIRTYSLALFMLDISVICVALAVLRLEYQIAATRQMTNESAAKQDLLGLRSWRGISVGHLTISCRGTWFRVYASESVLLRCDASGSESPSVLLEIPPGEHVIQIVSGIRGMPKGIRATRFTHGVEGDSNLVALPGEFHASEISTKGGRFIVWSCGNDNDWELCKFKTNLGDVRILVSWKNGPPYNVCDFFQMEASHFFQEFGFL